MLEIQQVDKRFGPVEVLRHVSLQVATGQIAVLLGPSGSGKTTLLRVVAGLEQPDRGRVLLDGQDLTAVPVHSRGFGFVFQDYALFPHKTVGQNVAFGLRMRRWATSDIAARLTQVLDLVGLVGFEDRPIHQLSGGEQQRVALARSLAPLPQLLLLDEPLGALDRALRERLMGELRAILKRAARLAPPTENGPPAAITTLYVTHDQAEAFAVADFIAVINHGRLEQLGPPEQLFLRPANAFVARFLGMENLLPATLIERDPIVARTALGNLELSGPGSFGGPTLAESLLLIRPGAARLVSGPAADAASNVVAATLAERSFRGRYQLVTVHPTAAPELTLKLEFDSTVSLPPAGSQVELALDPDSLILLA